MGLIMYNCTTSCRDLFDTYSMHIYAHFEWNILGYHPGIQKSERVGKNDLRACAVGSKGTGSFQRNTTWIINTFLTSSLFQQKQQVPSNLYFWSPSYNKCIGGFCFTIFQSEKFLLCLCWILLAFLSICMFANVFCSKNDSWESWFDQKCLIFTKW